MCRNWKNQYKKEFRANRKIIGFPCKDRIEKICSKCKILKPIEFFSTSQTEYDGRSTSCKECNAKATALRRLTLIETGNYINRTEKYCHLCDQVLPITEFFNDISSPDKHQDGCFLCTKFLNNQRCRVKSLFRYGGKKSN